MFKIRPLRALPYVVFSLLQFVCSSAAGELPTATPEEAGLSRAGLDRSKSVMQTMVDQKQTAGAILAVARRGKVIPLQVVGMMDIEAGKPMQPDTIFRIYSMTKPITTVAALILWEEGRFQLDDPVSKYLPALKGPRVHAGKGEDTVAAGREITIRDLMRHTSGLTYGIFGDSPVDLLYRKSNLLDRNNTLEDMAEKLSKLPLLNQPGKRFNYSVSTDVLGRLVEVVSGKPLDIFFEERIFTPLDMKDTGFFVPKEKLSRLATTYGPGKDGLKVIDDPVTSNFGSRPRLLSGGGGLVSTARDYLRFCAMLAGGGKLQATRLLRAETIEQMTTNQLPDSAMPLTLVVPRPGVGFGLGFSIHVAKSALEPAAAVGEYGWGGLASTHFWISPKHQIVVVALQQYMPFNTRLESALKPILYEALAN